MQTNFTKKSLLLLTTLIYCSLGSVQAQENNEKEKPKEGKNIIKWNFAAMALKNYSFQYERGITKSISVALGVRHAPKSNIPFAKEVEKRLDDPELWDQIKNFKTGNTAITPEIRFYTGKGLKGFYVAPFARYAKYSAEVPYKFEVDYEVTPGVPETRSEEIFLSGDVTSLTAGLMIGAQWKLSRLVYLDWWILGGSYGTSSGSISGLAKNKLDNDEQEALRDALEELQELPLIKSESEVTEDGAKVKFDGPWATVRAGLSIGFRF